ncbi:WbwZ [Cellvibrio sp. BR]|uniref:glycosyltransferase family 4 protein n=1 Tax=Cellvibrio sp. BR TaxID=1134474 RepID=UPI000260127E|nr:glycosyltransferase family 4 protein [Cellvibrio sp. BR]EIK46677.1 WbwZ [Cellvibrio sp. BR]
MKIVHVITRSDEIGGAQIHLKDLCVGLNSMGHNVTIAAGGNGIFFEKLSQSGIKYFSLKHLVRPINIISDIRAISELIHLLREVNPDIVTAHSFKAGLVARLSCLLIHKQCIFTVHGWSFIKCATSLTKLIYICIEKILSIASYQIITVCENDKLYAITSGISNKKKLSMIYNGAPDIDKSLIAHHRNISPKIVMIARFDWPKDHKSLIEALSELKKFDWILQLVGDGPQIEKIKDDVRRLGLTDRVEFLGRRENIAEILRDSDIFVLTSHSEGFPISIIEAMRASLPVIATDTGGISESVIDGKTGFIVKDKNIIDLREKLTILLCDSNLRKNMGLCGRDLYLELFTIEKMTCSTAAIYELALNKIHSRKV